MIDVQVVYCDPEVNLVELSVPAGSIVQEILNRPQVQALTPEIDKLAVAIWGKKVNKNTPVVNNCRIELLRPLIISPMEARRIRAKRAKAN